MTERLDAFLSYGFRPFFLFAGIYAVVGMAAWMAWIGLHAANAVVLRMSTDFPPFQWHAHEMLFGYTAAVVAGFLLTATSGWTGRGPVAGRPLALLAAAWVLGRVAVWFSAFLHSLLVATADLMFLALLTGFVFRTLVGGKPRHLIFLALLIVLIAANALVHGERLGLAAGTADAGHRLALDTVILLIAIIGGRVVPAFTRNVLRREGESDPVPARPWIDRLALASVAVVVVVDQIPESETAAGWIAIAAALANGLRLGGWRGWRVLDQPILWITHVGYGWLVVGLACKGIALLTGAMAETTAIHVLTVGAIGSMTLGIMTRAGLGHTGRPLRVAGSVTAAYLVLSLATVIRVAGPLWLPEYYNVAVLTAGTGWCVAFAVFTWVYWPILTRPRIGGED